MRVVVLFLVVAAFGVTAFTISTFIHDQNLSKGQGDEDSKTDDRDSPAGPSATFDPQTGPKPVPVAINRGPEVRDGFRGDAHPVLFGHTQLEVKAEWTPIGKGRDQLDAHLDKRVYAWFTDLSPAQPRRTYTEHDFSAFLPSNVGEVGQTWAIDPEKVLVFLKQFHPRPSLHLVAPGRRAGPDGAFAILRAMSPSHLDIVFRIHAEFYVTPDEERASYSPISAWYTPAYFTGRVLVNRQKGTIDHFRLALANDRALNVHLTVDRASTSTQPHDIVRVDRMELMGGDGILIDKIPWTIALPLADAQGKLAKVFYKSLEIDWVPVDQALARARNLGRPIFALVSWGATDDQSC
jgi:hypothetical protein